MNNIDVHADDFGYSISTSRNILDCIEKGKLTSISIMGNMKAFEDSMAMMYDRIACFPFLPLMSIHINIPEGTFLNDCFPMSWGKLFFLSYSPYKKRIKGLLKEEIRNQIRVVQRAIENCIRIAKDNNIECFQKSVRIDSHIHTHLLPIVWEALIEVIQEDDLDVEYIRNPKEPLAPFIKNISLWPTYSLINLVKNRILMFYSGKVDRYCAKHGIRKMYMWGLMMSGKMDYDRITVLFDDMLNTSRKNDRKLELLFHPGRCDNDDFSTEMIKEYYDNFNSSLNREVEKESLMKLDAFTDKRN